MYELFHISSFLDFNLYEWNIFGEINNANESNSMKKIEKQSNPKEMILIIIYYHKIII